MTRQFSRFQIKPISKSKSNNNKKEIQPNSNFNQNFKAY